MSDESLRDDHADFPALMTEELHRAVDSRFDLAQGLAQQGLIALARGDAPRALALFREALPLQRQYPMSPWVTKGLASFLVAYAAVLEGGQLLAIGRQASL